MKVKPTLAVCFTGTFNYDRETEWPIRIKRRTILIQLNGESLGGSGGYGNGFRVLFCERVLSCVAFFHQCDFDVAFAITKK